MSESETKSTRSGTFGIPESHFLRLAADLLTGLELQSRERGHSALASLVDIAKMEAEDALRINIETHPGSSGQTKLLRFVKAIRGQATTAENSSDEATAKSAKSQKTPSG